MKTFLTVTLALVLSSGVVMAERTRAAVKPFHGVFPIGTYWIGYPSHDGATAAATFAAHVSDAMPPVMVTTGDNGADRFVVFFQVRGDGFFFPDASLIYSPSATNVEAARRCENSKARLKGVMSLPDGQSMMWEVSP